MFDPSPKQCDALQNMESYIGVDAGRSIFKDKDEFQKYWDDLSKRCDEKSKRLERDKNNPVGKQIRQQRYLQNKTSYYNDQASLKQYAKKYLKRYRVSRNKLEAQLYLKSQNKALASQVRALFDEQLNDDQLALQLCDRMREQGKNRNYIKNKLRQRLFDADCIERCLKIACAETGSAWDKDALLKKVQQLQRKGHSIQHIRLNLVEHQSDKALVEAAIKQVFSENNDRDNLQKAINKLINKNIDQQDIIKRLSRKGFRYQDIKQALTEMSD